MSLKFSHNRITAAGNVNAKPRPIDYDGVAVTPTNATNLPNGNARAISVTGTGNISGTTPSGATFVLTGVPANTIIPIEVSIIAATGTTATGIYALY